MVIGGSKRITIQQQRNAKTKCYSSQKDSLKAVSFLDSIPPSHKPENGYGQHAKNRLKATEDVPKARERIMKEHKRWIYLQCIGVHPSAVGKGHGKRMLNLLIQTADLLNVPLYLETESESNEAMYKHFGFRTAEKIHLCAEGDTVKQPMWLMIKDAKV